MSRFLVLADDPQSDDAARAGLVRRLVAGRAPMMGLGDRHHEAQKVLLVEDPGADGVVRFRLLQVTGAHHAVQSRVECVDAAPAAALWARLRGGQDTTVGEPWRATNAGTGQHVELRSPAGRSPWAGDWAVRFSASASLRAVLAAVASPSEVTGAVATCIVTSGTLFVLAAVDPDRPSPAFVQRLVAAGRTHRAENGLAPGTVEVVLHTRDDGRGMGQPAWRAACFSGGSRERSLAAPAAMALGAFLTARGLVDVSAGAGRAARSVVRLRHPSGEVTVRVDLAERTDPSSVEAVSFFTPVRLLLAGTAFLQDGA